MQHPCSTPGVTWETQTRPPDTVHSARGHLLELAVLLAGRVTGHDLQPIGGPASLLPLRPRGQAQTCARSRAQKCSRQPWPHALKGSPMPVKFGKGIYHDRSQKPGLSGG